MDGNSFRSNLWNEANCDGSSIAYVLYINSHAQINGRWLVAPLSKGLSACRAYTGKLLHKVPGRVSSDGAEMREVQCWSSHQSLSRVLSSLSQQSTCLGECHQCVKVGWFNHGKEKETFCESIDSRVSQVQVLLEGLLFLLWTTKLVVDWSYRDLCRFVHEILKSPFAIPWGMMIWHEALNSLHNVSRLWSRSWSVNKYSKATTTETRSLRPKQKLLKWNWEVLCEMWSRERGCRLCKCFRVQGGHYRKMQLPRAPHPNCRCVPTRYVANLAALEQCTSQNFEDMKWYEKSMWISIPCLILKVTGTMDWWRISCEFQTSIESAGLNKS